MARWLDLKQLVIVADDEAVYILCLEIEIEESW